LLHEGHAASNHPEEVAAGPTHNQKHKNCLCGDTGINAPQACGFKAPVTQTTKHKYR
jgi:hypothetical protein